MLEGAFTQIYVAADGVQLDVHPPIPARSGEQPESHSFFLTSPVLRCCSQEKQL